jgi:release factor glutamine methyltransferase
VNSDNRQVPAPEPSPPPPAADRWTVRRILEWTTGHLQKHGSESPRLDAEILLAHARNCPRVQLYVQYDQELTDAQRAAMRELVKRRANLEPVAHLVGHREFFSLDFEVTRDTLIPRPDTETLVVELLERARPLAEPRILEIGTGTGCIAIAAAANLPAATITATDISEAALVVARRNAARHGVSARIEFLQGDLFAPLPADARFDLIVSNPPYVGEDELPTLQAEVARHEPKLALVAGRDGLDVIRRLLAESPRHLLPGGSLLFEIAPEQARTVEALANETGRYAGVSVVKDLSRAERVVIATPRGDGVTE